MRSKKRKNKKVNRKIAENSVNINNLNSRNKRNQPSRRTQTRRKIQDDDENENINDVIRKNKKGLTQEEVIKKKKRRIIRWFIIINLFIILLIMFVVSLVKWNKIMKDVMKVQNSVIVDSTGNVIAVLGETRIQETVSLEKIPKNLVNAYVSIEDKNFYKHHGINVKRTVGAIGSYIIHRGSASYGGSTITQQLVKNITGENESSISRKMVEWDRAVKTEMVLSKDQIMQTYLNIIYVGPNVYGVEMGSKYYFNKSVSDLDLAECAFLAGLNHSPNSYNPFGEKDNSDKIKSRSKTVLNVMLEENYITRDEYDAAVAEIDAGLKFEKGEVKPKGDGVYSYMVDATISEVVEDLKKKKKMSTSFATNYLYFSGLKIYCTQNSDIQKNLEDEFSQKKYMIWSDNNEKATAQAAMVVMDHTNGQIMGCVRRAW